jgi:hypothetical protein
MRCVRDWSAEITRKAEVDYFTAKAELVVLREWAKREEAEGTPWAPSLRAQETILCNRCGRLYRKWQRAQAIEEAAKVCALAVAYEKLGPPPSSIDEMVDSFRLYSHSLKN